MSTEETLVNFFAYSLCIYPVTNWFVARHVKYVKYRSCFEGNIVDYDKKSGTNTCTYLYIHSLILYANYDRNN